MRAFFALLVLLPLAAARAPLLNAEEKTAVPDEYIVVFRDNSTFTGRSKHMGMVRAAIMETRIEAEPKILHEYNMEGFKGYAFRGGEDVLEKVRDCGQVNYVERNLEVHAIQTQCVEQFGATWGLVRTNERALNLDGTYQHHSNAGEGVTVFIVDTGIYTEHSDFEGRAEWGTDTVDTPSPRTDENGHGTHVAGTVIGNTYGLAKKATAVAVKVLNRSGSGTWAQVIAGVEYTASSTKRPAVANMSLGGGRQESLNQAVAAAVDAGVVFVVAAGNENTDACSRSPASEPSAITVGSTTNTDQRSSFSNYGSCVDVFAPGSSITSTWIGGQYATNTISGTSMASPHIAGIAAKILGEESSLTPAQVETRIVETATNNVIVNPGTGSPNKLGFHDCP